MPDLIAGLHEAAEILQVSDTRVLQLLVSDPKFPQPFDEIKASRLWWKADLAYYALTREKKKPGRPRKKREE